MPPPGIAPKGSPDGGRWSGSPAPRTATGCMCSCPGPGTRPPCTQWSGPNPKGRPSLICPTGRSATATPSSPRRCRAPATRGWRSTPPAPWTCGGCRPPSCGPNATGSAVCSTRPPGIGRGSLRGPASAEPQPTRPWSSSPPHTNTSAMAGGCFACAGRPSRPRPIGPRRCWPASRPTAPPTPSSGCASSSSAGLAGWRPTPTSAPPTARSSASWPGSAVPAASHRSRSQPRYLRGELGPVPESTRGRRAWRQAAAAIEDYRRTYHITDPEQALGRMPREPAQRAAWQHARQAITRVQGRQHRIDHDRQPQRGAASRRQSIDRHQQDQPPTRTERAVPPGRPGPERAAG